ncbi:diacylglycerol/lipid kinase family protein [Yoonia sp.]|uniref:diacylglycerol/lipid kinase family protein n=1 Tax=Yoonia sp. TaxID=2212373 RepID=UPI00391CAE8D
MSSHIETLPPQSDDILVIVNAGSGKKSGAEKHVAMMDRIEGHKGVTIKRMSPNMDITEFAARGVADGFGTIVAAGGDGTISGVCAGLSGTDVKLGVVPLGTFNFFARSLGIPQDPCEAWDIILAGHCRRVSIGEINGKRFLNNASIGAYATVLQVRENIYERWGRSRLTAYWSVIKAMSTRYRSLRLRITVDGTVHEIRSPMAFVAVRPYQLEEYGLPGVQSIREGEMVLYLAPTGGRLNLLLTALKVLNRKVQQDKDYTMLTGSEIIIETFRRKRLVAWDGERSQMSDPFHFKMLKDDLNVIVPARAMPVP